MLHQLHATRRDAVTVKLLARISERLSSNLGLDSDYSELGPYRKFC
jgi:hypothetical protein